MLILCFRAIINHFNPKIESYAAVNHISQLSEEQVSHCFPQSDPDWWLKSSNCPFSDSRASMGSGKSQTAKKH